MAGFLFWNLQKKNLRAEVARLADEHAIEVIVLAESGIDPNTLLLELFRRTGFWFSYPFNLSPRLQFYIRYPTDAFESMHDSNTLSIRRLKHPLGSQLIIGALHLPSLYFYSPTEQIQFSCRTATELRETLAAEPQLPALILGDFNMDPFHEGIVGSEGFHAIMDRRIAARRTRTIQGVERRLFYNPMWGRMGDMSQGPPGTYFHSGSTPVAYFWHTFDQVIMTSELVEFFPEDKMRVVDTLSGSTMSCPDGRPDATRFADHFPLVFELEIERMVTV